jgi:acetylornithine deacetylase/succinyl-diaminopimelate desuccinylase-like protein
MVHGGKAAGRRRADKVGFVPVCPVEIGVETLLLGLSLPDDNAHSPNEKFDLDCFHAGMRMSALLWPELAKV